MSELSPAQRTAGTARILVTAGVAGRARGDMAGLGRPDRHRQRDCTGPSAAGCCSSPSAPTDRPPPGHPTRRGPRRPAPHPLAHGLRGDPRRRLPDRRRAHRHRQRRPRPVGGGARLPRDSPRALVWRNPSPDWKLFVLLLPLASRLSLMTNPIFAQLTRDWGHDRPLRRRRPPPVRATTSAAC
jgi:hypothetical protein